MAPARGGDRLNEVASAGCPAESGSGVAIHSRPVFLPKVLVESPGQPNTCLALGRAELFPQATETSQRPIVKLTDLRGILQYIPQFREKTFVLALVASGQTGCNGVPGIFSKEILGSRARRTARSTALRA